MIFTGTPKLAFSFLIGLYGRLFEPRYIPIGQQLIGLYGQLFEPRDIHSGHISSGPQSLFLPLLIRATATISVV